VSGTRLPPEPQRGPDVLGPVVCNVAGILLLVVAWVVTSGHPSFGAQLPSVNLGVAGVLLANAMLSLVRNLAPRMTQDRLA